MKTLTIHDMHSQLAGILTAIEQRGEWFVICRDNIPIVDIIPHR